MIDEIVVWIGSQPSTVVYLVLLVVAYLENVLPPIPGDLLLAFGGFLVAEHVLSATPLVLVSTLGGAVGYMHMYYFGRRWGVKAIDHGWLAWVGTRRISRSLAWIRRFGLGIVYANRFISGLRSVIALASGMSRLAAGKTLFAATVSSLVWTILMVMAGYWLGTNWSLVEVGLQRYGLGLGLLIAIGATSVLLRRILTKNKASSGFRGDSNR